MKEIFHRNVYPLLDPDHGVFDFADYPLEFRSVATGFTLELAGMLSSDRLDGLRQTAIFSKTFTVKLLHVRSKTRSTIVSARGAERSLSNATERTHFSTNERNHQ